MRSARSARVPAASSCPAEATHPELSQLTAREREILIELAGGFSNADR
jgi:DNA-binding NarL/FixJ family response regulator